MRSAIDTTAAYPRSSVFPRASKSGPEVVQGPVILRSAFQPPVARQLQPTWMRNPQMIRYSFTRATATLSLNGDVVFASMEQEEIEIAKDWEKGEKLYKQGKPHEATGYIGMGYTKRGIYVSCLKWNDGQ